MKFEELFQKKDGCIKAFMCRCSPEDIAEADAVKEEVYRRLGEDANPGNLLTKVVSSLNWDFGARITGIYDDQWSVVHVSSWEDSEEKLDVAIECDEVEDGIAAAWLAFASGNLSKGNLSKSDVE